MQETSALHKSILSDREHVKETRVEIAGTLYSESCFLPPSLSRVLFSEGKPCVGGCPSGTIKLSIWVDSSEIPRGAKIRVEQRVVLLDARTEVVASAAEWLPKGTYYVSGRSTDPTTGATVLSGYDGMRKADQPYVSEVDTGVWPCPCDQVAASIAERMGVTIDSRTILDPSIMVEYPLDYTMREVLGQIAVAHLGNWVMTDANELRLIGLCETLDDAAESARVIASGLTHFTVGAALRPYSKVVLWYDDNTCYMAGDDTGQTLEADLPWATQAIADKLLDQVKDFVYIPFEGQRALLDPAAELGDSLTIHDISCQLASVEVTCDAMNAANIAAPSGDELDDEYPYTAKQKREFARKLAETRSLITKTAEEIRLEVANEVQGLSASFDVQLGSISAEIVGVENAISSLELDVESILGRIQDAEGNVAQLELTAQEIRSEVSGKIDEEAAQTLIDQAIDSIALSVTSSAGSTTIKLTGGGVDISTATLNLSVAAANISGKLTASQIDAESLRVSKVYDSTGTKTAIDCSSTATMYIGGTGSANAYSEILIKGTTIAFNTWGSTEAGISIHNASSYYLRPETSGLYSLGDSTHLWHGVYTNDITITPNSNLLYGMTLNYAGIIPAKTEYMNLGSSTYKWNCLYVKSIMLDGMTLYPDRISYSSTIYASMNSAKAFVPYASTGYSIGSSIFPWATGYFTTLYVGGKEVSATPEVSQLKNGSYTVSLNTSYALVPGSSSYSLGSSSYYWGTAYITKLYLSSTCYISAGSASTIKVGTTTIGGTVTVSALTNGTYSVTLGSGALTPKSSGSYSLGSSSYYWSYLYVGAIRLYYSSYSYITLTANSSGKLCVGGTAIH